MRIFGVVIIVLVALLSVAAGWAKLAQAPQEAEFFTNVGLNPFWLYPLGLLQVGGALACIFPKTTRIGLAAIALGFAISSVMIFMAGNIAFGVVALVPVMLAVWLVNRPPRLSAG